MNLSTLENRYVNEAGPAPLIGLASLAKMTFSGVDLTPLGRRLAHHAACNPDDINVLMDLSTILHLTGNRDIALALQAQALETRQLFRLSCASGRVGIRLLAIMSPGDLTLNNAVEFLVEGSDVTLDMLYVAEDLPLPASLPDHDLAIVAVCESDRNRPLLKHIEGLIRSWPRPVLNAPDRIARLSRDGASALLSALPGIEMPISARINRQTLEQIGHGRLSITSLLEDGNFPVIVRPVDSHKGQGLAKLDAASDIADYLQSQPESEFYVARFVDYRGPDGLFRKYRIVLIDGRPFACHMAISEHWVVHYMSAGMTDNPEKRAEEARFMAQFDEAFGRRHAEAFQAIADRVGLEYVGMDCGETVDGKLLIFEVDSGMTVHAMDPVDVFPYKQPQMRKVFDAFYAMLARAMKRG
jgi:glutathione synthase/RimK-type ligase-like ATP-grasp enzyme